MENEIWRGIEGYENYEVSNLGRVRSLNYRQTGKTMVLKPVKDGCGYLNANIYKDGKIRCLGVNRLVASAFIPNPLNKTDVNHKDENKENNRVENLEWLSHKENCNFGTRNERSSKARINHPKRSKPVLQYTKEGVFIKEYPSTNEAERQTGIHQGNIVSCCNGKRKSVGGYVWKYKVLR